jgi:hypothetical protein
MGREVFNKVTGLPSMAEWSLIWEEWEDVTVIEKRWSIKGSFSIMKIIIVRVVRLKTN